MSHTFRCRLLSNNLTELIAKWRRVWSQSSSSSDRDTRSKRPDIPESRLREQPSPLKDCKILEMPELVTEVPMILSLGQSAVVAEIRSRSCATNGRRADASVAALEKPTTAVARSASDCNSSSDWTSSSVTSMPISTLRVFAAAGAERGRERASEREREADREREREREVRQSMQEEADRVREQLEAALLDSSLCSLSPSQGASSLSPCIRMQGRRMLIQDKREELEEVGPEVRQACHVGERFTSTSSASRPRTLTQLCNPTSPFDRHLRHIRADRFLGHSDGHMI